MFSYFFFKGLMQIIARTKWLWNITECQKQQTTVGDKITRRQKSARYRPADRAASAPGETRREGGGGRRWVGVYGQRQRAQNKSQRVRMWFRDGVQCLHGLPGGMALVFGGRTLLAWEARRSDPASPLLCLTLPLPPAAQGHAMVWERLMHLQRHAVKSN